MKTYRLGLELAGKVYFVLEIPAESFSHAAKSWAHLTGHLDCLYDMENNTYFGWPVVETTEEIIDRSSVKMNPFQY